MKPIPFKGQNTVAAKNQPQYNPLPAYISPANTGNVVTCWKMSWRERLTALVTGKVWMELLMFRNEHTNDLNPITPSKLSVSRDELIGNIDLVTLNLEAIAAHLEMSRRGHPEGTQFMIVLHNDLYTNPGVNIQFGERMLDGTPIMNYNDVKSYMPELAEPTSRGMFYVVQLPDEAKRPQPSEDDVVNAAKRQVEDIFKKYDTCKNCNCDGPGCPGWENKNQQTK